MRKNRHIEINIAEQKLRLFAGNRVLKEYLVSTAKNGPGEEMDSECTPRGKHIIAEKIGHGCETNTVFVGREPTGEIYRTDMRNEFPERDWIVTRILWLSGAEKGKNCGENIDSHNRYIYIHGAPEDVEMGKPGSRGCIRMNNEDVMDLFDRVEEGTSVIIAEN